MYFTIRLCSRKMKMKMNFNFKYEHSLDPTSPILSQLKYFQMKIHNM